MSDSKQQDSKDSPDTPPQDEPQDQLLSSNPQAPPNSTPGLTSNSTPAASHSASPTESLKAFDQEPVLAYIEVDRFCAHCGYNLHGRPVRRESNTQLLLTNCPECGRMAQANQSTIAAFPWLRRITTVVFLLWAFVLVILLFWEVGGQIGLWITLADEMRRYTFYRGGINFGNEETLAMFIAMPAGSMALSAFAVGFITVVASHWQRWGYYALVIARPIVIFIAIAMIWSFAYPKYYELIYPYLVGSLISVFGGGILGLHCARPLTRLIVRIALPRRFVLPMAFLWLVDGKTPPGAKHDTEPDTKNNPPGSQDP